MKVITQFKKTQY